MKRLYCHRCDKTRLCEQSQKPDGIFSYSCGKCGHDLDSECCHKFWKTQDDFDTAQELESGWL